MSATPLNANLRTDRNQLRVVNSRRIALTIWGNDCSARLVSLFNIKLTYV